MKASLVVSAYNEELVLRSFYKQMMSALETCQCEYELIFVNDGSTDKSQEIIDEISHENPNVKSILFQKTSDTKPQWLQGLIMPAEMR